MHTFTSCLLHCVFATKDRAHVLSADTRARLCPTLALAKAMQLLKGNSSKWLHDTFPAMRNVAWQEGYGAFSIGASGIDATVACIRNQEEHHRVRTFREEIEGFLRRHGMAYEASMLG